MQISVVTNETLDAIYTIDEVARNYDNQSVEASRRGFEQEAKVLTIKKSALRRYKSYILGELHDGGHVDHVRRLNADQGEFYHFQFNEHDFHAPTDDFGKRIDIDTVEKKRVINGDFQPDTSREKGLPMSEQTALQHLQTTFVSANQFIEPKILSNATSSRPVCWQYLDGYVEKESRVPESAFSRYQEQSSVRQSYQFAVGDIFKSVDKGTIQILDRGGLWTDAVSAVDHDRVSCRPAYDVRLNEQEYRQNVQQEHITRDWCISLQDTHASGVTRISGDAYHRYTLDRLSAVPSMESGDRLRFDDGSSATVDDIYTQGFVLVYYDISGDEDNWTGQFTANQFLHDVDYIQRGGDKTVVNW